MEGCDVLLPPQVLLVLRTHGSHHVVEVHDDVNEAVNDANEGTMASRVVFGGTPTDHWHHRVMIQMKESNLVVFLPENEEDRVQKL